VTRRSTKKLGKQFLRKTFVCIFIFMETNKRASSTGETKEQQEAKGSSNKQKLVK
jgi:hypothetical protein